MIITRKKLILFTAFIWLIAAYMLIHRAYLWKELFSESQLILSILIAISLGTLKSYLIFHKITMENIHRIMKLEANKVTLWQFHATRQKITILIMIALGLTLRHLPFVPKEVLMPIYLAIGLAMVYVVILYLIKGILK